VKDAAERLDPAIEIYTMGSYRRGAETCGDVCPHLKNQYNYLDRFDDHQT